MSRFYFPQDRNIEGEIIFKPSEKLKTVTNKDVYNNRDVFKGIFDEEKFSDLTEYVAANIHYDDECYKFKNETQYEDERYNDCDGDNPFEEEEEAYADDVEISKYDPCRDCGKVDTCTNMCEAWYAFHQ